MTDTPKPAERRILDGIGDEKRLPVLGVPMIEVYFVAFAAFVGLFAATLLGVGTLQWPVVGLATLVGLLLAYASPSHVSTVRWFKAGGRYLLRPRITFAAAEDAPSREKNDGGLANVTPFEPDERTQELTHVERAWPETGAVLRDGGTMEAFVELRPENMDFATSDDWAAKQRAAEEFANRTLTDDLKFHATTEAVDIRAVIDRLEGRLGDSDVENRPVLRALLEEYIERRPEQMRDRGTQNIRYFLGVTVDEDEITESNREEREPLEKLARLPVLGLLFSPFVTRSSDLSERERYGRMIERLDDRVTEVRDGFVQDARGLHARRLSTVELFALNARFWNGRDRIDEDQVEAVFADAVSGDAERRTGGDQR